MLKFLSATAVARLTGTAAVTTGLATADNVCAACTAGTFAATGDANCAACTVVANSLAATALTCTTAARKTCQRI